MDDLPSLVKKKINQMSCVFRKLGRHRIRNAANWAMRDLDMVQLSLVGSENRLRRKQDVEGTGYT